MDNLGRRLVELKEACPHGTFAQVSEEQCGLKKSQCQNIMKVYREFGQMPNQLGFSSTVLLELSKSLDPQVALDEANDQKEQGGSITAK